MTAWLRPSAFCNRGVVPVLRVAARQGAPTAAAYRNRAGVRDNTGLAAKPWRIPTTVQEGRRRLLPTEWMDEEWMA